MGTHLIMMDGKGNHVPEWDSDRYVGDGDISKLAEPFIRARPYDPDDHDEIPFRPENMEEFRRRILQRNENPEAPNRGRFLQVLELLERNPDYWLYISY